MVTGITIKLLNAQSRLVLSTGVFGNGLYQFANIPTGQEYTLVPELQGQACSTFQPWISSWGSAHTGIIQLDSPLKVLVGDVNQSNSLTTLDLALIRQMVLGITADFPVNWRFSGQILGLLTTTTPGKGFRWRRRFLSSGRGHYRYSFYAVRWGIWRAGAEGWKAVDKSGAPKR